MLSISGALSTLASTVPTKNHPIQTTEDINVALSEDNQLPLSPVDHLLDVNVECPAQWSILCDGCCRCIIGLDGKPFLICDENTDDCIKNHDDCKKHCECKQTKEALRSWGSRFFEY